jgi:hypothetical protein
MPIPDFAIFRYLFARVLRCPFSSRPATASQARGARIYRSGFSCRSSLFCLVAYSGVPRCPLHFCCRTCFFRQAPCRKKRTIDSQHRVPTGGTSAIYREGLSLAREPIAGRSTFSFIERFRIAFRKTSLPSFEKYCVRLQRSMKENVDRPAIGSRASEALPINCRRPAGLFFPACRDARFLSGGDRRRNS